MIHTTCNLTGARERVPTPIPCTKRKALPSIITTRNPAYLPSELAVSTKGILLRSVVTLTSDLDDADPPVDGIDFEGADKCGSAVTRDDTNMSLKLIQVLGERIPKTHGEMFTNGGDCRCRAGCAISPKVRDLISLIFRL